MAGETTTDPILSTKLHRPPVERNHVHRLHLSERLDQPRSKPLTLVSAPAGDEPQPSSFPNRFDSRSAFHLFVLIMILLLSAPLSTWAEDTSKIELSPQEKAWLEANPELGRIAFQLRARVQLSAAEREWLTFKPKVPIRTGDYPPFHFDVDDIPKGLSVDYVKVICMAQNLDCHFVTGMAIADSIHSMQQPGGIAIQPGWQKNTAREKVAFFTGPYVVFPFVIFQRQRSKRIIGMEDLLGKRIVVEKNYAIHKMLKRDYPGLQLVEVNFSTEALELLATDGADAYVSSLMVGHYLSIKLGLPNIVVASPAPFEPLPDRSGIYEVIRIHELALDLSLSFEIYGMEPKLNFALNIVGFISFACGIASVNPTMGAGQQINAIGLPRPVKTNAGPNAFLLEAEPMA